MKYFVKRIIAGFILCSCSTAVLAQELMHPDFVMEPIPFKGFLLSPSVEVEARYDDNVFVTETNEQGDFLSMVRPNLVITKEIGRHSFALEGGGQIKRYREFESENTNEVNAEFRGNLEAYHNLDIPFSISYATDHRDRTNRSSGIITEKPVGFSTFSSSAGITYQPNRLNIELLGTYTEIRGEDSRNILTGEIRPGEDRDINQYTAALTTQYDTGAWFTPKAAIIYQANDDLVPTFTGQGFNGEERDNTVWRFLTGLAVDYKSLVLGSFGIGYETRDYKASTIDGISALALSADIGFQITPKTLITFEAERTTKEENEILAGLTATSFELGLMRELNSRLSAEGKFSVVYSDFSNSVREDTEYKAGLGLRYILQKGLYLDSQYSFGTRDSTQNGLSFDRNVFMLNLRKEF